MHVCANSVHIHAFLQWISYIKENAFSHCCKSSLSYYWDSPISLSMDSLTVYLTLDGFHFKIYPVRIDCYLMKTALVGADLIQWLIFRMLQGTNETNLCLQRYFMHYSSVSFDCGVVNVITVANQAADTRLSHYLHWGRLIFGPDEVSIPYGVPDCESSNLVLCFCFAW